MSQISRADRRASRVRMPSVIDPSSRSFDRKVPGSRPQDTGRRDPRPRDVGNDVGHARLGDLSPLVPEQHVAAARVLPQLSLQGFAAAGLVVERRIRAVHGARGEAHPLDRGPGHGRQRLRRHGCPSAAIHDDPHLVVLGRQPRGQLVQRRPQRRKIDGDVEILGALRQPGEMAVEKKPSLGRRPENRLQELQRRRSCALPPAEDARLDFAFLVFLARVRLPENPAAHPVLGAVEGPVDRDGADGHVELRLQPAAVRRRVPDGARVQPARRGFDLGDDSHRAHLRRARDRGAREERRQDAAERARHAGPDRGGHLQDGGEALDLAQTGDRDGADLGDPADVVADHVHDHEVFRPVLFRALQPPRVFLVFPHRPAPRGGALHGPRHERARP